ncbi:hypothetical protein Pelo_14262 [Pelomyxa schiedti]|nr:hypothetical protein Pelo_14262 [Pelomyxa schiedti]
MRVVPLHGSATTRAASVSRAVSTSMVVWEWVLPWLLPAPLLLRAPAQSYRLGTTLTAVGVDHAISLFTIAEAMFPLVGRACSSVLANWEHWSLAVGWAAEAGSRLCVGWLLRSRRRAGVGPGGTRRILRRRGNKAFMRVLEGLCVGGHLGMARSLVDPDGGDHGDGGDGGCGGDWAAGLGLVWQDGGVDRDGDDDWVVGDSGLVDHVRASDLLKGVCEKGHVEVAKWVIERFLMKDPWDLAAPLSGAVSGGHLELAQWLVNTFHLAPKFKGGRRWSDLHKEACKSENLEVVKWCLGTFPVANIPFHAIHQSLVGKSSKSVEVCKFIKWRISTSLRHGAPDPSFAFINNLDVLKWALSANYHSFGTPTKENLEILCAESEGVQFCQWLVEERSFTPTPLMFCSACNNSEDNTQTAKWLSTRVPLSPEDICDSFSSSLAHNNTSIASWLDETFHILNRLSSNGNFSSSSILVTLCKKIGYYESKAGGMAWFLNHTSTTKGVDEAVIVNCIELLLDKAAFQAAMLLLEHFHISDPKRNQLLERFLYRCVLGGHISTAKEIISMGELSKESVAKCLVDSAEVKSTKVAKWLINHFQLERQHIALDKMLFKLIKWGQGSCVEWLINKFHITLDEFLHLKWEKESQNWIDLFTWKMILQVFPGLTADMIKERFLPLVCKSPVIAQVSLKRFPQLTMDDIVAFCSSTADYHFSLATRLWLKEHNHLQHE